MKTLIAVVFSLAAAAPASAQMFSYNPNAGMPYGGYAAPIYQAPTYQAPQPYQAPQVQMHRYETQREIVCRRHAITGDVHCRER